MILNGLYLIALVLLSPWLLWRMLRTSRYRRDLAPKLTGRVDCQPSGRFTVWFHGVSVGEIHLLTTLIDAYRKQFPDHRVVVSSTTDTGLAEARKKWDAVVPWPFDFSWAVSAALDRVKPDLVVLAEGEMWPNFLKAANARNIPVAVINARMSPRSFRRYSFVAGLARRFLLNRVSVIAVQDEAYANMFRMLGMPMEKLRVTGSIKFDGALKQPLPPLPGFAGIGWGKVVTRSLQNPPPASGKTREGGQNDPLILVAGSTHAPEESIILDAFAQLHRELPSLKLILVPRHPDRFEEVNALLEQSGLPFQRRSRTPEPTAPILLLDTVGELSAAWNLADLGYVGGTLDGRRGGQSMIEPAGFGVPTVFGPHVWNFADAAKRLVEAGGAVMIREPEELAAVLRELGRDAERRQQIGHLARRLVEHSAGATFRTIELLNQLSQRQSQRIAA